MASAIQADNDLTRGLLHLQNFNVSYSKDNGSTVEIRSNSLSNAGTVFTIWGDPHQYIAQGAQRKNLQDFYTDQSYVLDDGTKITVGVKPDPNGSKDASGRVVSYVDSLTITQPPSSNFPQGLAIQITGIYKNPVIQEFETQQNDNWKTLDAQVNDGSYIYRLKFNVDLTDPNFSCLYDPLLDLSQDQLIGNVHSLGQTGMLSYDPVGDKNLTAMMESFLKQINASNQSRTSRDSSPSLSGQSVQTPVI